jgi:hypothetical protein
MLERNLGLAIVAIHPNSAQILHINKATRDPAAAK